MKPETKDLLLYWAKFLAVVFIVLPPLLVLFFKWTVFVAGVLG